MDVLPLNRWYGKLAALGAFLALPVAFFFHLYFDPVRRLEIGFRPLKTLSTYSVLVGYIAGWYEGAPKKPATSYMGRTAAVPQQSRAQTGAESRTAKTASDLARAEVQVGSQRVSIIVPSWSGDADRLMESIKEQTYKNYEVQIVKGMSPAGRARNFGVKNTSGEILLFVDDDAYFGSPDVVETLVRTIVADPTVGVAGTSKLVPEDAGLLQKAIAKQVPRMVYPVLSETTESNPPLEGYGYTAITTTCCAMRRSVFDEAGGFDEGLTRSGEDTDFFYRVHRNGWRMMVAGNCWVYHDPPASLKDLLRKSFWYGVGHAAEARKSPDRGMAVIPLNKWYGKLVLPLAVLAFLPALFIHVYFDPVLKLAFGFRPLKTLSTYAVLCGYVYGWYNDRTPRPITTYLGRKRAADAEEA
jgi:GT2 family glycosyltransferase